MERCSILSSSQMTCPTPTVTPELKVKGVWFQLDNVRVHYESIKVPAHLSVSLSAYMSFCPICMSIYVLMCLVTCLCLSVCLPTCLSVYISAYLTISPLSVFTIYLSACLLWLRAPYTLTRLYTLTPVCPSGSKLHLLPQP